ncbi:MAG: AAA family ATPase [Myxococcales bacterium]|nr:AAA family ATPase [Myxococcales bacterium]
MSEPLNGSQELAIRVNARGRLAEPFPLVGVREIPPIVEQNWLIEGLVPMLSDGAIGYLFGPAKSRKSLLLADFALSVATGTPALGRFLAPHQGRVVGFFAEDSKQETARRIHRLARARGVEVPHNLLLIDVPGLALDCGWQQQRLAVTLSSIDDLALVWLDPMVRLHSVNDNRAEELAPIHTYLRTLIRECSGATLLLAHHTNKSGDSRGSTEYGAIGDFNLYLETQSDKVTRVKRIENRGGPPGKPFRFSVEDGDTEEGSTLSLVASDDAPVAKVRGTDAREQILAYRRAHPDSSGNAAEKVLRANGLRLSRDNFLLYWKEAQE